MRYIYITSLVDFTISDRLNAPIEIKDGLYVTNNSAHVAGYISTASIVSIGSLEARSLTGSIPVIYRLDNQAEFTDAKVEVINFLREVQAFLTATWLTRDNSANCELAFAFCLDAQYVHSNALALHYLDHAGARCHMAVDRAELAEICAMHRQNFVGIRQQNAPLHTSSQKSIARLSRAMRFLQQARSSDDLGQKVANYCSFFEALLSTSSSELSHQLSERVAVFLRDKPTERLSLFKEMKRAYNVRSKIVHGDVLAPATISSLAGVCLMCDEAARQTVHKVVSSAELTKLFDESGNDVLDSYMMNLVFGVSPISGIDARATEA